MEFLFRPVSASPIVAFRIFFGVILIIKSLLLFKERQEWHYGVLAHYHVSRHLLTLLVVFALVASLALTIGIYPQIASLVGLVCFITFHRINPDVSFGADFVQNLFLFLLILIPANAQVVPQWMLLLLQGQLLILYAKSAIAKLHGEVWRNGKALFYVLSLPNFTRFSIKPETLRELPTGILTRSIIAIEIIGPLALIFPATRMVGIVLLLVLHLGIEVFMNLQLFEWTMAAALLLFLPVP